MLLDCAIGGCSARLCFVRLCSDKPCSVSCVAKFSCDSGLLHCVFTFCCDCVLLMFVLCSVIFYSLILRFVTVIC